MATAVFTFGRMNPPTVGHEKLVNKVKAEAKGGPAFVYLSHSQNPAKDPLSYNDKIKYATAAFGRIIKKSTARTIIEVMKELENNYSAVKLVVGSDRVKEFKTLLNKYNGKDYNFDKIEVVSAGERDPDSEGVSGMSASKMREAVKNNEFATFRLGLPKKLKSSDLEIFKKVQQGMNIKESIEEAIDATPKGRPFTFTIEEDDIDDEELEKLAKTMDDEDMEDLGVDMAKFIQDLDDEDEEDDDEMDEERKPLSIAQRRKIGLRMKRLAPRMKRFRALRKKRMATPERLVFRARKKAVQILRKRVAGKKGEQYASLSPAEKIGVDRMIMKKRPLVAKLAKRLLPKVKKAEMERLKQARQSKNESFEMFIERAIQDPDIKDRKGTQPAKYHKGLSPSTKAKRDAQFKRQADMADDNPAAYKPAPGDATATTKLSKYTKQYRDTYGEAVSPEITVGSYTTTHFHMCGSAIKAMKKYSDVEGAEQMTKLQDDFYKMEKEVMERGAANNDEKQKAQKLYNQIMSLAKKADIEKPIGSYMKMHLNSILKGDPKPGFGMINEQDATQQTKARHERERAQAEREKELRKARHDREMDAARAKDTRAINVRTEAKRGRPKKGESEEEGIEHIQVQLRKVINLRGMRPVEFTNGKKAKVSVQVAQRVLDVINKTKEAKGKQEIVKYIQKSPENLNSVAAGKPVQKADKFALPALKSLGAQTDYVGTARVSGISGSYARNMGKLEGFDINAMFESVVDKAKNIDESFEAYLNEKEIKSYKQHSRSSIAPRDNYLLEKDMEGLRKKADKTGISYGTLKKVYDRGVAAWKSGHRPGTTPSQWGYARVNAFIAKKKKGNLNHDTDLAHYEDIRGELMSESGAGEIGTATLTKKYQSDTPGQESKIQLAIDYIKKPEIAPTAKQLQSKLDEEFEEFLDVVMIDQPSDLNESFTAGIPDAPFAHELGMRAFGGFAHHPSVEEAMNRKQQAAIAIAKKESGKYDEESEHENCGCNPEPIEEAEYQGKQVKLNDPIRTSEVPSKKFKVYVRDPDSGNIKVVRFGDPNLSIKRDDPDRRKSFRARHNCDNPGPKTKARYWSCYQWRGGAKVDN